MSYGKITFLPASLFFAVWISVSDATAALDEFVELPRELEVELALSALPEHLQSEATIYVRDPQRGFILHRSGTNGWSAFVARTSTRFYESDWEYQYPSDQIIPQAHDETGMAHHVVPYFDLEKMRIDNIPAAKAKATLRQQFSNGTYTAPREAGMSYMLAPIHRAYMEPSRSALVDTVSFPHYMPYAPHVNAETLGAMDRYHRAGVLGHGGKDSGPHGYFYFMVQPDYAEEIRKKYANLLARLCHQHLNWCLSKATE